MNIESTFLNNGKIPVKYTADSENINPEIIITKIPKNAKTLVLIVDDLDSQRICGFAWIHWIVSDILVNSEKVIIEENSIPGISGKNSFNKKEYDGPCPPKGTGAHHYHFKLYALDVKLGLPEMSPLDKINEKMQGHILDKEEIIGVYER
jgi:hypothetical protein